LCVRQRARTYKKVTTYRLSDNPLKAYCKQ